jgi:ribonuclease-3 family protein
MSQIQQLTPISLAYLGDCVYELWIRQAYLLPPKRIATYHRQVVAQVRAEQQAAYLTALEPYLTDAEQTIVKRGRNAALKSKRAAPEIYRQATALEALVGYLYLTDLPRLQELLNYLDLPT